MQTLPLPLPPRPPWKYPRPTPPTTLTGNKDTFANKLHKVQLLFHGERRNGYRCCYMYSGGSRMGVCPTSRPVSCETVVFCCVYIYKGMGALFSDNGEITVHFPLFIYFIFFTLFLSFERERSVLARFLHEHPLRQYSRGKHRDRRVNWQIYIWDILSTWPRVSKFLRRFGSVLKKNKVPVFDSVSVPRTSPRWIVLVVWLALVA